MEERLVNICGNDCSACLSFKVTPQDDDHLRAEIARARTGSGDVFTPEDINCDGCRVEGGRKLDFCTSCDVRKCGAARELESCAFCDDYPCEQLVPGPSGWLVVQKGRQGSRRLGKHGNPHWTKSVESLKKRRYFFL